MVSPSGWRPNGRDGARTFALLVRADILARRANLSLNPVDPALCGFNKLLISVPSLSWHGGCASGSPLSQSPPKATRKEEHGGGNPTSMRQTARLARAKRRSVRHRNRNDPNSINVGGRLMKRLILSVVGLLGLALTVPALGGGINLSGPHYN